jgi:hypothetical protein
MVVPGHRRAPTGEGDHDQDRREAIGIVFFMTTPIDT